MIQSSVSMPVTASLTLPKHWNKCSPIFGRCARTTLRCRLRAAAESRQAESRQVEYRTEDEEEELTEKMAEFLRQQAERESGGLVAVPDEPPQEALGTEVVSQEEAKKYCREVMGAVRDLRQTRDMSINEIKLTLAIEDPTVREQRDYLGIEDGAGVSRDEIAAALLEVTAGRIPLDRLALRELWREIREWPYLNAAEELQAEQQAQADYEGITDTGVRNQPGSTSSNRARPPVGRDKSEAPQSLTDMLPDWMGYGFLYLVSAIPVLITVSVLAILFFNSLH